MESVAAPGSCPGPHRPRPFLPTGWQSPQAARLLRTRPCFQGRFGLQGSRGTCWFCGAPGALVCRDPPASPTEAASPSHHPGKTLQGRPCASSAADAPTLAGSPARGDTREGHAGAEPLPSEGRRPRDSSPCLKISILGITLWGAPSEQGLSSPLNYTL